MFASNFRRITYNRCTDCRDDRFCNACRCVEQVQVAEAWCLVNPLSRAWGWSSAGPVSASVRGHESKGIVPIVGYIRSDPISSPEDDGASGNWVAARCFRWEPAM